MWYYTREFFRDRGYKMKFPKDPVMLLSAVNTALRDYYKSFDELVEDNEIDGDEIIAKLASIDYHYDPEMNKFR